MRRKRRRTAALLQGVSKHFFVAAWLEEFPVLGLKVPKIFRKDKQFIHVHCRSQLNERFVSQMGGLRMWVPVGLRLNAVQRGSHGRTPGERGSGEGLWAMTVAVNGRRLRVGLKML